MEKDVVAEHLLGKCGYNARGEEIPDPRPVELPVGFKHPKSLQETMRDLLRNEEFRRALDKHEMDTFEEADDFETGEDDPMAGPTPYEKEFDPDHVATREQEIRSGFVEEIPPEKKEKAKEVLERYRPKKKKKAEEPPKPEAAEGDED